MHKAVKDAMKSNGAASSISARHNDGKISPPDVDVESTAWSSANGRRAAFRSSVKLRMVSLACAMSGLFSFGCNKSAPPTSDAKAPEVYVAVPTVREVTDFEDFTGRLEAVSVVEIRARVTGYLDRVCFKEGADVKAGDVLFEIDPRTYRAEAARAEANLQQAIAHQLRIKRDLDRAGPLLASRAMGQEEYDRLAGDFSEANAAVGVAQGSAEIAKLNLSFCQVKSPISGRMSKQWIDPGNLVKADDTRLSSVVSLDPIHVYFDIDERTVLKIRRLIREGKMKSARQNATTVQIGLADEEEFSLAGTIDFVDNRIDHGTGTLRVRAVAPNPNLLLSSGLFVRIRLPIGGKYPALMVPERALASDQGQRYVYVVDANNTILYKRILAGGQFGTDRVVREGLTAQDRVVVSGLQRVRPGIKVVAKPAELLNPASPAADAKAALADQSNPLRAPSSQPTVANKAVEAPPTRTPGG